MQELSHYSVLLTEAITNLQIKPNGIYVDCTLGGGGHSAAILAKLVSGRLIAFEQDNYALERARARLASCPNHAAVTYIHNNFANLKSELLQLGITKVDGILYDLGVSSFQLDDGARGFSYNTDARLDMRMDQGQELSAYEVVNNYDVSELSRIIWQYGEEKFALQIARQIIKYRETKPLETTLELVDVIRKALPAKQLRVSGHPAKKTFQALRIYVNAELTCLEASLHDALDLLNQNGRIVAISFHSLEDRIVKQAFKKACTLDLPKGMPFIPEGYQLNYQLICNKAILPSDEELQENHRSHSAKMRVIERITKTEA